MEVPGLGVIAFRQGKPGVMHAAKGRLVKGSGVSHLVEQRRLEGVDGERVAMAMPRVIQRGVRSEAYGPPGTHLRMNITLGEYTAVLSQRDGQSGWWLLTGWKR